MYKVLFVTDTFPTDEEDYAGKAVYDLVKELVKLDVKIAVLTPVVTGLEPKDFKIISPSRELPKIKYLTLGVNFLYMAVKLLLYVITDKPKIVHVQWVFPYGLLAVPLKKMLNIKLIMTARGSDLRVIPKKNLLLKKLISYSLKKADYVITVSEELRSVALKLGAVSDKVSTIPSSVDESIFNPMVSGQEVKKNHNLENNFTVLFIGNLIPLKGINELLEGFKKFNKLQPDSKLLIIGTGFLADSIISFGKENDLQDSLVLIGKVPHNKVPEYLNSADCFILPSYSEGLPLVILEAMACKTPVIATRVGGIPEVVENNKTGLLISPKSSEAIVEAFEELKDNPQKGLEMAEEAFKMVKGSFTYEHAAQENRKAYKKIIDG